MNYVLLLGLKNWKTVLIAGIMALGMTMALFFSVLQGDQPPEKGFEGGGGGVALVSPLVMRYEPLVRKYAQQYGVEQYVPLLLAKMMQESGGKLPDVMQSSESLGLPMNTIQDPEFSINVGVRYFSGIIKQTKDDIKLTLQSYNFGTGYIPYALKHGGGYSKANAIAFSNMMAAKMGWKRYGDINYPDHVLRYLKQDAAPVASIPIISGGSAGVASWYLSTFKISTRFTPYGNSADKVHQGGVHNGIDFARKGSASIEGMPVRSLIDGVVEQVLINNPGAGNGVRIRSGSFQFSYIHMQYPPPVKVGNKIKVSQVIGKIGNTGFSTGPHLDLKIRDYSSGGNYIDPEKVLKQMVAGK